MDLNITSYVDTETSYWYKPAFNSGGSLPTQTLPFGKKDKVWKQTTMDTLERLGLAQVRDNMKFRDIYRMIDGKMSYTELRDTIPQLREVASMMDTANIPTTIRHHDILGIVINALVGEYMSFNDQFHIENRDEISSNEFERQKTDMLRKYINEKIHMEVIMRMLEMGINPETDLEQFETPEEQEAYIQQVQQIQEELTPPQIQEYMSTEWKTASAIWANGTLEADSNRFFFNELDRKNVRDYFATGRCFREFLIGHDFYKPEYWSPITTFFSEELSVEHVQDSEYVGKIDFLTGSQVVSEYGHLITQKEKDIVLGRKEGESLLKGMRGGKGQQEPFKLYEQQTVPHVQYHDYNLMLGVQDVMGVPMGNYTYKNKNGEEITQSRFLPERNFGTVSLGTQLAKQIRDDINVRSDLYQVTKAYWRSFREVGLITYETDTGQIVQTLVTDEILKDLIRDYGIKNIRTTSFQKAVDDPEPNTIVWDYVPEVWKGVKVSGGHLDEPLYLDIEPLEFQLKGDSNIYDVKLPVAGYVDSALANKIQPYQIAYNVLMNQAYNLLEKEIGAFFLFDFNFLPSEIKNFGDTEESLLLLRDMVKSSGLFPVDTSTQNLHGGIQFNQFSVQDLSFSRQIQEKLTLAEMYKQKAYEQIGFNPQRLGTPTAYTTAEGVKQSQMASFSQTESYFNKFYNFKLRALEMHINVAQYAQGNNKDLTVHYTKSDVSQAYLEHIKLEDPYFPLRRLGLLPAGDIAQRRNFELFKNYILQNNTMGIDTYELAKIISSDTFAEIIEITRRERLRQEEQMQQQQQAQAEAMQQQIEMANQLDQQNWERGEFSKQKDRETKIDVARIQALGRAMDKQTDQQDLVFLTAESDRALKREELNAEIENREGQLQLAEQKENNLNEERLRQFSLRTQELAARREQMENDRYIAQINKN